MGSDIAGMGMGMQSLGTDAAKNADLVQFKVQMDGLKKRLANAPSEEEELQKACRDFEAVFIGKLWEQMEKSVPKEGYLHSKQEGMYKSMFNKEFSESMADAGGIGLADMLYDQLAQKLKQVSGDTLAANSNIKPLSQNGKPDLRTMEQVREDLTSLQGAEPKGPTDIIPEPIGQSSNAADSQGGYEMEKQAAEAIGPVTRLETPTRDVSGLTRTEVEGELNQLARTLRGSTFAQGPGASFDSARKGAFLSSNEEDGEDGRILAEI